MVLVVLMEDTVGTGGGGQWLHSALGVVCNYLGLDTDFGSRLGCISRGDPQTVLVVVVVLSANLQGVL